MRYGLTMRSLTVMVLCLLAFEPSALAAAWDKPGWQLTFQDEFDGAQVDAAKWGKRYKWGEAQINSELQAYVDDAFQVQNGTLTIVGDKRTASYAGQTFQYASGVLCSVLEQKYGYFEARLKVPAGQGMWPAFWLLGKVESSGVDEIDIHEILGQEPSTVYMTVHWGTDYSSGHKSDGSSWVGPDFSADFHVFGLEWNPDSIVWTIDGVERKRHTGDGVPQVEMYIIINLAVGGSWPGPPDSTTTFPGLYQIDYVRAYTRQPDAGVADSGGGSDGGVVATGGTTASGGVRGTGGSTATGGMTGTGGSAATGGAPGTGGTITTGGAGGRGAAIGTGGVSGTGGITGGSGCSCRIGSAPSGSAMMVFVLFLLVRRSGRRQLQRNLAGLGEGQRVACQAAMDATGIPRHEVSFG
jgi:MYXO-CTERM domain-containing protein